MNKVYFSWLTGFNKEEVKEFMEGLPVVAKEHNGTCYKCGNNTDLFVSFTTVDDRRNFNKVVQKTRKQLPVIIDTCETKSVESYFGTIDYNTI